MSTHTQDLTLLSAGGHTEQGGQVPPEERLLRLQALRCLINTLVSLVQWYARSNPEAMTEYGQTGVEERGSKGTPGPALMLHGRTTSEDRVKVQGHVARADWLHGGDAGWSIA